MLAFYPRANRGDALAGGLFIHLVAIFSSAQGHVLRFLFQGWFSGTCVPGDCVRGGLASAKAFRSPVSMNFRVENAIPPLKSEHKRPDSHAQFRDNAMVCTRPGPE